MIESNMVYRELNAALEEAVASLRREGLDDNEARDEASDYVGIPSKIGASELAVSRLLDELGATSVPSEFLELVSSFDLGQIHVWDADFRPMRGCREVTGASYLDTVLGQTALLRDDLGCDRSGVVIGSTEHGQMLFQTVFPEPDGNCVLVIDHDNGQLLFSAASSVVDFLVANARLAKFYWERAENPHSAGDWIEEIIKEVGDSNTNPNWMRFSLSQRPRPF